jgi:hypothetical protein
MASRKATSRKSTSRSGASGRITPKGTRPGGARRITRPTRPGDEAAGDLHESGRYTPPTVDKSQQPSPRWVPILMFALWAVGVLVIILNYLGFLPGDTDNRYLLLGLGLITGGFLAATQYR